MYDCVSCSNKFTLMDTIINGSVIYQQLWNNLKCKNCIGFSADDFYMFPNNNSFQIVLKLLNGEKYTIILNNDMTFKNMMKEIQKACKIPVGQIRLIFHRKKLPHFEDEDANRKISDFNFTNNNVVHLVYRLCPSKKFQYAKEDWFEE